MTPHIDTGVASAAPNFDAAQWTAAWTAIGGGYARTDAGLFLFWDDVQDAAARSRLHRQLAGPEASRALFDHLGARQPGGPAA